MHYESLADTGSYKTDAALRARAPFQNVHAHTANDLLVARETPSAQTRPDIRRITQLGFARDLAESFQNEVAPRVVDLQGRTLKLAGTAEEQYREWRRLLHQMYVEENRGVTVDTLPAAAPGLSDPDPH